METYRYLVSQPFPIANGSPYTGERRSSTVLRAMAMRKAISLDSAQQTRAMSTSCECRSKSVGSESSSSSRRSVSFCQCGPTIYSYVSNEPEWEDITEEWQKVAPAQQKAKKRVVSPSPVYTLCVALGLVQTRGGRRHSGGVTQRRSAFHHSRQNTV